MVRYKARKDNDQQKNLYKLPDCLTRIVYHFEYVSLMYNSSNAKKKYKYGHLSVIQIYNWHGGS